MGTTLSFAAWMIVSRWEDRVAELEFSLRANNVASALQTGLNGYFDNVVALRALFESSAQGVSRSDFAIFADQLLPGQTAILGVSWIPRVMRDERAAHESAAVGEGLVGYHVKTVTAEGGMVVSPQQDEYFPVYYTTEGRSANQVYGLNLGDTEIRKQPLERARDGNLLAASENFVLQSGTADRRGFFVVLPVYRRGLPHEAVDDRRRNLLGFVQGVFQSDAMVETILGGFKSRVDLYIFAPGTNPSGLPIHVFSSKLRQTPSEPKPQAALNTGLHWSGELKVADIQWKLIAVPFGGAGTASDAWLLLIVGLLLTGMVGIFMWRSRRYALYLSRANRKISELARTDTLTTLANRREFLDQLAASFAAGNRAASPFAVLYCDLDHFKDVNDTLGHPLGDALLRQVAERLKKTVRDNDLIARFGGDEFAVLQTDAVDVATINTLARKIIEMLATPFSIEGSEVQITASMGISLYSAQLSGPDAMMIQADLALYRAKADGRNCFRFHSSDLDLEVRERVTIADELRIALDRSEFELHYQPQVELASGRIVGLEALIRWKHPKRGLVMPSKFIAIAERSGAIVPIGRWAFDQACRQLKLWLDEGIAPETVAVNCSAVQFRGQPDLERDIADSLANSGIASDRMEIELTESVLMEVTQQHRDTLKRLRHLGARIAIDDFGTGYSSLSYLANYPANRLKIAQELMAGVDSDPRNAAVVRAAIQLARELGIEIIAEGVETQAQVNFLISAGCTLGQGYLFSRPVTAKRAGRLLRRGTIETAASQKRNEHLAAA